MYKCEKHGELDSGYCDKCEKTIMCDTTPKDILEPPDGCQAIPGFILTVGNKGESWLTQGGEKTDVWKERGIWPTVEEAKATLNLFVGDE